MVLWHAGLGALITYISLGRRRIDYRYVLLGAVLPDVVDAIAAFFIELPSLRGPAHTLLVVVAVAVLIVVFFRAERRLAVFGLAVGWLTHLVADGMWAAPRTLYWPAFGTAFESSPRESYSVDLIVHPADHLAAWGAEFVGLAILVWFWVAFGLGRGDRLRQFLQDGYLRP
ncbi:MAG: metal-dependent hydrolase [Actinomycetota bacterium]